MEIKLRNYQQEAIDAFFEALPEHRRQLITLPTGSGKTVVFGSVAKRYDDTMKSEKPILVLAHRTQLLEQAEAKLNMVWPGVLTGRVQAERKEQLAQVILASTQTLVAGRKIREPSLVIYDESHHARAEGALRVLEELGVFREDGPPLLGVTATPIRGDKAELGDVFEHLTYQRTILQMVMDGYLCDVRGKKVVIPNLELKQVRMSAGDYNAQDLSLAMNHDIAVNTVVEAVVQHARDRKSIIFAVDVQHAKALADRFKLAGYKAAAIDGTMKYEERTKILQDFADNKLSILVNVNEKTESHSRSKSAAVQPDEERQTMMTGESVSEWLQRIAVLEKNEQQAEDQFVQSVNLFANRTRFRWEQVKDHFAISYGDGHWAYLILEGRNWWPVIELNVQKYLPLHDQALPLEYAQGIAEGFLELLESKVIQKDADWRTAPISQRQSYMLDKYRIKHDSTWTRGMASDELNKRFARRQVKQVLAAFNPDKWRKA